MRPCEVILLRVFQIKIALRIKTRFYDLRTDMRYLNEHDCFGHRSGGQHVVHIVCMCFFLCFKLVCASFAILDTWRTHQILHDIYVE